MEKAHSSHTSPFSKGMETKKNCNALQHFKCHFKQHVTTDLSIDVPHDTH